MSAVRAPRARTEVVRLTPRRKLIVAGAAVACVLALVIVWRASSDGSAAASARASSA